MYQKLRGVVTLVVVVGAVVMLLPQQPANAVPAFARRLGGVDCTLCHWHISALNGTGKEFLRRGLRMPGEDTSTALADAALGGYASAMAGPTLSSEGGSTKFSAGDAELWLAGPIDRRFSALAEIEFIVDDEEVAVEEIYAQYISGTGDDYSSARVGQFQPLLLLAQISGPPRVSLSRPSVLSGRATNGNGWRPRSRLRGVEAGHVWGRNSAYLGLGNGEGQNEDDNHMDVYVTLERQFGDEGTSVGLYGYWGSTPLDEGFRDDFNRYGALGNYTSGKNRIVGGYFLGTNDNPMDGELDNSGWFLEGERLLRDDTVLYARWDKFSADVDSSERETKGPTIGLSWRPSSNTRVTLEGQWMDVGTDTEQRFEGEFHIAL